LNRSAARPENDPHATVIQDSIRAGQRVSGFGNNAKYRVQTISSIVTALHRTNMDSWESVSATRSFWLSDAAPASEVMRDMFLAKRVRPSQLEGRKRLDYGLEVLESQVLQSINIVIKFYLYPP
jgi:hypothetical protein